MIKRFLKSDDGAVVVDWVVVTACVVGLAMVIMVTMSGGMSTSSAQLSSDIASVAGNANDL